MANLFENVGLSPKPDNLVAGNHFPVETDVVTLVPGTYKRGDFLVLDSETGTWALATGVEEGPAGANERFAVLLDNKIANDVEGNKGVAAFTGEFNVLAMRFGGTTTWDIYQYAASAQGIFLKENQPAPALAV